MSRTEKNNRIVSAAIILPILSIFIFFLFLPSHTTSFQEELRMVPGTALAHCHISPSFDVDFLTYIPDNYISADFIADLLKKGPIGISITTFDFVNFSLQYLILSRNTSMDEMRTLLIGYYGGSAVLEDSRVYIQNDSGSIIASITEKQGWTAVFIGYGSSAAAGRWLNMEEETSLAADSVLVCMTNAPADISALITNNTVILLNIFPGGFLPRTEQILLGATNSFISSLKVHAACINLSLPESRSVVELSLIIGHANCTKTSFMLEFDKANFPPDSLLNMMIYQGSPFQ